MMNRPDRIPRNAAFTLIEVLVVISLITLLISMLSPSLRAMKEEGRATVCMARLDQIGDATRMYGDDFEDNYPYGVPKSYLVVNHPHYEGWMPGGGRGGGVPPQQQFFDQGYIRDTKGWKCPTDPHPQNYVWWDFTVHPDFTSGSSFMFSEYALFGIEWHERRMLKFGMVFQPSNFGWATDGWECPNGWTWDTVNPANPLVRIDWSHMDNVNVLYGDNHVHRHPQELAGLEIRTHPLYDY